MPLQKLSIQPGVVKDTTPALAEGRWVDSDKIRFHLGLPRVIGGWERQEFDQSDPKILPKNPFSVLQGSSLVTVTSLAHGQVTGNTVSFRGANPVQLAAWGLNLNTYFTILRILDNNRYIIQATTASTTTGTGGGAQVQASYSLFYGAIRNLQSWTATNGTQYQAVGTDNKLYIFLGGVQYDITPQGNPVALPANPFTTNVTAGTANSITVNAPAHGAFVGQGVTFSGATVVGGLDMNKSFIIQSVAANGDSYTVQATTSASTAEVGGGGAVEARYDIQIKPQVVLEGWSNGAWSGSFGWSEGPAITGNTSAYAVTWFFALFKQTLLFAPRGGSLYKWDPSDDTVSDRGQLVVGGPKGISAGLIVSGTGQHVIAVGAARSTDPEDTNPVLILFSNAGSYTIWAAAPDRSAGGAVAGGVSRLISAREVNNQIVIWSESKIFTLNAIGSPGVFSLSAIGTNAGIIGPNATVAAEGMAFWMGDNNFYAYNGASPQTIPCTVRDFVFEDMNTEVEYQQKTFCVTNSGFSEIWWFYPSVGSQECNKYVTYNYLEKVWAVGTFDISAAEDRGSQEFPVWAHFNNYLYDHEYKLTADGALIEAVIQSGPLDIAAGQEFVFADRIIPDIQFTTGSVSVLIEARTYPNSIPTLFGPFEFLPTKTVDGVTTEGTTEVYPRARGRSLAFTFRSADTGVPENTNWRLGDIIVSIQPSGMK